MSETQRSFLLVPVDGFSLLSFAAVVDPLRAACRILDRPVYSWSVASVDGAPVASSSGFEVPAAFAVAKAPPVDLMLVFAGLVSRIGDTTALQGDLRRRVRGGEAVGAVSTGAIVLGRAGLLDGYRCTVHWEARASFAKANEGATVTEAPYEIDRNRYTSGGGTASIDMMLDVIAHDHGDALARKVANQLQHERIRSSADRQRIAGEPDLVGKPVVMVRLIRLMADNLEEPLSARDLASRVGLSVRQVERHFERHCGTTPTNFYIGLRLDRARELLRQTRASVLDVALDTGFASQSHFAQSYRLRFGCTPSRERRPGSRAVAPAGRRAPEDRVTANQ